MGIGICWDSLSTRGNIADGHPKGNNPVTWRSSCFASWNKYDLNTVFFSWRRAAKCYLVCCLVEPTAWITWTLSSREGHHKGETAVCTQPKVQGKGRVWNCSKSQIFAKGHKFRSESLSRARNSLIWLANFQSTIFHLCFDILHYPASGIALHFFTQ